MSETIKKVYVGRRLAEKDTLFQHFIDLNSDNELDKQHAHYFPSKKVVITGAYVGAVYEFVGTSEGGLYTSGTKAPKYLGVYHDKDSIVTWTTIDSENYAQSMRKSKLKKDSKEYDYFRECLEPIAKAMSKTNAIGRRLIIAEIISVLTSNNWEF